MRKIFNSIVKRTKVVQDLQKDIQALQNVVSDQLQGDFVVTLNNGVKAYVPCMFKDVIQKQQASTRDFYEKNILTQLNDYMPDGAVILDVGSNVGNHSLYWASEKKAKRIFAFEPVKDTFAILAKNIEINNLSKVVTAFNMGAGAAPAQAKIKHFRAENIGGTSLQVDADGELQIEALDNIKEIQSQKIDFIKIDTEGFEMDALVGMEKLIAAHQPQIFIETFSKTYATVNKMLTGWGYQQIKQFDGDNYLYRYQK